MGDVLYFLLQNSPDSSILPTYDQMLMYGCWCQLHHENWYSSNKGRVVKMQSRKMFKVQNFYRMEHFFKICDQNFRTFLYIFNAIHFYNSEQRYSNGPFRQCLPLLVQMLRMSGNGRWALRRDRSRIWVWNIWNFKIRALFSFKVITKISELFSDWTKFLECAFFYSTKLYAIILKAESDVKLLLLS